MTLNGTYFTVKGVSHEKVYQLSSDSAKPNSNTVLYSTAQRSTRWRTVEFHSTESRDFILV